MLGNNIRMFRTRNGLSQQELSEKLNVSRPTISSWELNRTEPTMGNIEQLAQVFHCRKSELIGDAWDSKVGVQDMIYSDSLVTELIEIAKESDSKDLEHVIEYLRLMKYKPLVDSILKLNNEKSTD